MNKKTLIIIFASACFLFHGAMLLNLGLHFQFARYMPPKFQPVKSGTPRPAHWSSSKVNTGADDPNRFEKKLRIIQKREIQSKGLMAVPPRHTDNFGLDFLFRDANHTDPGGDFFQYYQSGYDARYGTSIFENYREDTPKDLVRKLKSVAPFHPPNRYPPGFVYTFGVILSLFSPWNAYVVWVLLHEAVLLLCVLLTWRMVRPDFFRFLFLAGLWTGFSPWYLELYMGQANFLIMAGIFFLGAYLLKHIGPFSAGLSWVVTLITKPMTLLFVPLFLVLKRYRLVVTVLAVSLAVNLPYFLVRPDDAELFINWSLGQEMVFNPGNYCFQNLLYHFHFSDTLVKVISYLLLGSGVAVTLLTGRRSPTANLALWTAIYMLSYAHVWQHHQVILLPAIILMLITSRRTRYIIPWAIMTIPSLFYIFESRFDWHRSIIYLAIGSLPALLIAIFATMDIFSERSKEIL